MGSLGGLKMKGTRPELRNIEKKIKQVRRKIMIAECRVNDLVLHVNDLEQQRNKIIERLKL